MESLQLQTQVDSVADRPVQSKYGPTTKSPLSISRHVETFLGLLTLNELAVATIAARSNNFIMFNAPQRLKGNVVVSRRAWSDLAGLDSSLPVGLSLWW
jgi:hypothetical protein